jgi:hypothetical protein
MPERKGDNESKRSQRGTYYSIGKRMESHGDFFKAVWDIQPAVMAMFGEEMQDIFHELHIARRHIEIACQKLNHHLDDAQLFPEPDKEFWQQLRTDLCGADVPFAPEGDRVGKKIASFKTGIERVCCPVVKHRVADRWGIKKGRRNHGALSAFVNGSQA